MTMKNDYKTVQRRAMPSAKASIPNTVNALEDGDDLVENTISDVVDELQEEADPEQAKFEKAIQRLASFFEAEGNISDLIDESILAEMGNQAVSEWQEDQGSIEPWKRMAEHGMHIASQDTDDEEPKDFPWNGSANIHYPILTEAATQFTARASAEIIQGTKAVSVKTFSPIMPAPSPQEISQLGPQPTNPQDAQASQMAAAEDQNKQMIATLREESKKARAKRVESYLNWCLFYKMANWTADTDLLLTQLPIFGIGFKKVYMTEDGIRSDYISPLNMTVHNDTKSMADCPRITHDFKLYPYQINENMRSGRYNEVELDTDEETQEQREIIEQYRFEDLDDDGLAEPYIVTVDVETSQVLRVEPAFTMEDVVINEKRKRIVKIERWNPFPSYSFLLDPKGGFYSMGLAKLLNPITDSIDSCMNQMMDAGAAQIAGGGFIGGNVRMTGSGQGGSMWFQPGEYKTVNVQGMDLKNAIFERTFPAPSEVTFQMMTMLMEQAKGIASVKDVTTGDSSTMAPVGTTLAVQDQALTSFASIYKRVRRGFDQEYKLMFKCIQKFADDRMRQEYSELTGGDMDEDFSGDGTDVQPVSDDATVSKMQRISKVQATMQLAESAVGQAAGMLDPKVAKALAIEMLEVFGMEQAERFVADVQPNKLAMEAEAAKIDESKASTELKRSQADKSQSDAMLAQTKSIRELGLTVVDAGEAQRAVEAAQQQNAQPQNSEGMNAAPNPLGQVG